MEASQAPAEMGWASGVDAVSQLRLVIDKSPIGMALVGVEGSFLATNQSLCDMLGRSATELTTATWQELTHPDDLSTDEALVREVLEGYRNDYRLRKRYLRPDGAVVWGDLSVAGIRDEAGSVLYFIAQILEVTEHIQATMDLRSSEARYRLLAEHASDVVTLVNVDGTLEWVSPSLTRSLGWEPEDVVGGPVWALIHPSDHEIVTFVLAADEASIHALPDIELRIALPDGSFVWMLAAGRHATPTQLVVSLRLAEETVRARESLKASEERYRLLAENASDVVFQTGSDGLLNWVSPSVTEVLGWNPKDLLGRRYTDLVHPEDVEKGRAEQRRAISAAKRPEAVEARIATADGGWLWMTDRGRAIQDADGRIIGGIDALRDIHDQVEAREALRTSESHFRLLANNSTDVVLRTRDGVILWVSPSVTRTLGWTPEEVTGTEVLAMIHEDDAAALPPAGTHIGVGLVQRYRLLSKDGEYRWCEVHSSDFMDEKGERDGAVASFRTIDGEIAAERELERRARYDDLTGTFKRAEALHRLALITGDVRRRGSLAAVLFCDVDNLKQVNDELGHAVGDELLRSVAARLRSTVRSTDTIARIGGDEFLVILESMHNLDDAKALAEKIRLAVTLPIRVGAVEASTSVSIGLTLAKAGEDPEATIARADHAMYEAKRAGRNTVRALNPVGPPT